MTHAISAVFSTGRIARPRRPRQQNFTHAFLVIGKRADAEDLPIVGFSETEYQARMYMAMQIRTAKKKLGVTDIAHSEIVAVSRGG
jgi:hypothetical protein